MPPPSSFFRISKFLKDHGYDILDVWMYKETISKVRIISRDQGHIVFLGIPSSYDLTLSQEEHDRYFPLTSSQTFVYYLEKTSSSVSSSDGGGGTLEATTEMMESIYKDIPPFETLLLCGCLLHQSSSSGETCVFTVRNLPDSERKSLYVYVSIEWFFENRYVVQCEVQKAVSTYPARTATLLQEWLPEFRSYLSPEEMTLLHTLGKREREAYEVGEKWIHFYRTLCESETHTLQRLNYCETLSQSSDLTFQESLRRDYDIRKYSEKLETYHQLRKKVSAKILFFYQQYWTNVLEWMGILYRCSHLLQQFQQHFRRLKTSFPSSFDMTRLR